jgi:2-hydroxyglutarate dehydrogenase
VIDRTSVSPAAECDVAVIGGGILGVAVARELLARQPGSRVCVLERELALATHQTGRSSGVVHAGIYYAPGSLKARLCVEGARELQAFCVGRGIRLERCGKLIVALDDAELPRLDELERRGKANGVEGLRHLDAGELRQIEPHAAGIAALHSPATGVVDFGAVTEALAEDVEADGGVVATGCEVSGVSERADGVTVTHTRGDTRAGRLVVCAGAWSDRLAEVAGAPADPRIVPFRGSYAALRPEKAELVKALIYPVPDPGLPFLGVHLSRMLDGRVVVGPTALLAVRRGAGDPAVRDLMSSASWPGTWRMAARWWRTGLTEIAHAASRASMARAAARYVPGITAADLEPAWSGIRAQAVGRDGRLLDDFTFSATARTLHVRNAPSPAATSALALARVIADRLPG